MTVAEEHPYDPISASFASMEDHVVKNPLLYMLTSRRKYVEHRFHVRVYMVEHDQVGMGEALVTWTRDHRSCIIFLSPQDVAEDLERVRFRIGHELGHLCGRHHLEIAALVKLGLGAKNDPVYERLKAEHEEEADVFAANMLLANGAVVERRLASEQEFDNIVESLANGAPGGRLTHVRQSAEFRRVIRASMREANLISPPMPVLCQALALALNGSSVVGERRKQLAKAVHAHYRGILAAGEKKPDDIRLCIDCTHATGLQCPERW